MDKGRPLLWFLPYSIDLDHRESLLELVTSHLFQVDICIPLHNRQLLNLSQVSHNTFLHYMADIGTRQSDLLCPLCGPLDRDIELETLCKRDSSTQRDIYFVPWIL